MLAAFTCGGCRSTPLTQYINNPIYQELMEEDEFTNAIRDDRITLTCEEVRAIQMSLKK